PLDMVDVIEQLVPLSLLGPLADRVPIGVRGTDLIENQVDEVSLVYEFNPLPGPLLEMSPIEGEPGETIELVGSNFSPSASITVRLDDTEMLVTETDENGSFRASFTFPSLPSDNYFVTARDDVGLFDFSVFRRP